MKLYLANLQLLHIGMPGDCEPRIGAPNVRITAHAEHCETIIINMYIEDAKNRSLGDIEKEVNQHLKELYSSSAE